MDNHGNFKSKFKVGDIVQLNSGGPVMTVQRVFEVGDHGGYNCTWFAGKKREDGVFYEDTLVAVTAQAAE